MDVRLNRVGAWDRHSFRNQVGPCRLRYVKAYFEVTLEVHILRWMFVIFVSPKVMSWVLESIRSTSLICLPLCFTFQQVSIARLLGTAWLSRQIKPLSTSMEVPNLHFCRQS